MWQLRTLSLSTFFPSVMAKMNNKKKGTAVIEATCASYMVGSYALLSVCLSVLRLDWTKIQTRKKFISPILLYVATTLSEN